jgi:nucleotide-binding universal stress UspA family protein
MSTIVVGYDGSESAKRALERAATLANGGPVTVVSAVYLHAPAVRGGPVIDPAEEAERKRELDEAKAILAAKGVAANTVVGHGDPAELLAAEAKDIGADLIVVGTRGLNLAKRAVLGSVSTKVVHEAPCDVLVVR